MKKLLFLITQSEWGGAQKYVFDLAIHLRYEYDVIVACGGKSGELIQRLNREGIRIILIRNIRRRINPFWDVLAFNEIFGILQREQPDIVHTNSTKAGVLGNAAAFIAGIRRIIFTAHGFVFNEPMIELKRRFFLFLEWFSGLAVDKVIAVSEYDRQSALRWHVYPVKKIVTVHNGVEDSHLASRNPSLSFRMTSGLRQEFNIPQNAVIVGTISNFYRTKGVQYFIQAIVKLKDEFPHAYFVIVGDGMLRSNIEYNIQVCHLQKNVILTGFQKDVMELLTEMDIFVLSSVKEGLPFSLLEAGALAKPVIVTCVGGMPEVIEDGITGLLVPPADPESLANAISKFLCDREVARLCGVRLQEKIVRNFQFSRMLEETVGVYEDIRFQPSRE